MTNSISEVLESDVIFIIGSNTTESHPVIGAKIRQAKRKGAQIIVVDPRKIDLSKDADVFLQIKPGTNIALVNGLMHIILKEGLHNKEFILERTENVLALEETVQKYTPEWVSEICGVDMEDLKKAARLYANANKGSIYYCMGITQHSSGVGNVMSVSNLALLCGHVGKEGTGVNPLRGQNNVQGACDMGALPNVFTGYQPVHKPEVLEKFETVWGTSLPSIPGLTAPEMLDHAAHGDLKFLYIMGENPVVSDPDIAHVKHALEKADFLLVQDIFLTETAMYADVVLPATSFAEKDGTFTNTERRVQRVRKAINPVGDSKPDWVILMEMMNSLGYVKTYNSSEEIMDEIASVTPSYGGIDYKRIEGEGIQWPCPTKEHPGTKLLHRDTFSRGKALFAAVEHEGSKEVPDGEYPFILTTGRTLYHYHTRSMTGRVDGLNKLVPESYVEINPHLGKKLNIHDGEMVVISSRRGHIHVKAKISERVKENVAFMPFHFAEGAANMLTNTVLDPVSKTPELKVCAVSIQKIVDGEIHDYYMQAATSQSK
ncbi:formate dehydrogenase major subunit [Anaerosolibacter carboniphilus]|nr:formate dehydrogenase major subunit [Anaerosolibacter carboniphilus]